MGCVQGMSHCVICARLAYFVEVTPEAREGRRP